VTGFEAHLLEQITRAALVHGTSASKPAHLL
jgi:hypothetical protein